MRKIELGGSFETLIPTVQFGNKTVFFYFKETLEGEFTDEQLRKIQEEKFRTFCIEPAELKEKEIQMDCIQRELKDLRILRCPKCNELHPSITTVRDYDSKGFYCTDEQLEIAIADGQIQDIRCKHFVKTCEWLDAEKIPACKPYLKVLKGSKTGYNNFDFPAFLKEFPIENMVNPERQWDCELGITYESDLIGTTKGWNIGTKKEPTIIQDLETVFDYKRNVDKDSAFFQMSIAAKNHGLKRMCAIPVNGETEKGWSKPVISNDVDGFIEVVKVQRSKFRKRYSI